MKKSFLCLGSLLVLFLVMGFCTAHAQDYAALTQLNGKWLKINGSLKGWTVPTTLTQNELAQVSSILLKNSYACVSYNPLDNDEAKTTIMNSNGTRIGSSVYLFFGWYCRSVVGLYTIKLGFKGRLFSERRRYRCAIGCARKDKERSGKRGIVQLLWYVYYNGQR